MISSLFPHKDDLFAFHKVFPLSDRHFLSFSERKVLKQSIKALFEFNFFCVLLEMNFFMFFSDVSTIPILSSWIKWMYASEIEVIIKKELI